jgi:hypothetical protein
LALSKKKVQSAQRTTGDQFNNTPSHSPADRKQEMLAGSLVEFFARSPLAGVKLDLERTQDFGRQENLFE